MTGKRIAFLLAVLPLPALAQIPGNSAPTPLPITDTIPAAQDVAYPGTLRLEVDATDIQRRIFRVRQVIPVAQAGKLVLLYPKWLPGNHQPAGQINKLTGLKITANGQPVPWDRDKVDVFAFHIDVPQGATEVVAEFHFVSPTTDNQGDRVVMTPEMLNVQWERVSLYPAGYYTRRIPVDASVKLPAGWKGFTALDAASAPDAANTLHYKTVPYEVLVDSPMFAGKHSRVETLGPGVRLNIVGDEPANLKMTDDQLKAHKGIYTQATKLFGAQHYDHYDLLLSLSDKMSGIGLEHHRSSENGVDSTYLTDWDLNLGDRTLLTHEYTHSWNGKFRRGADLWTPDYRTPMRNSLLWVYEGQTQFWGEILAVRAGMLSKEQGLGRLANLAASYDHQPGRQWRSVEDTTNDPIMADRPPLAWRSWQRSEDYYSEGMLVWLEADAIIRRGTAGRKGLDDFAKAFFGIRDRDWGEVTYTFDDVVATLNGVYGYDWATFLNDRIYKPGQPTPLAWIAAGGYRLDYVDEPNPAMISLEKSGKYVNLSYSGGFSVGNDGKVSSVIWDSPAFNQGLTVGTQIVAVNDVAFDGDKLKEALKANKGKANPIRLLTRSGDVYRTVDLPWNQGLRYPTLVKVAKGDGTLDALLAPVK
ncbi:M61 family metallopeptidase [Sphingomonas sp. ID0503]|uniref:M61 family metallopeptidase n=1 Tax=Sphingomonas sp. ID0503 TaxID=3399691 RepID=UPI003AFB81E0